MPTSIERRERLIQKIINEIINNFRESSFCSYTIYDYVPYQLVIDAHGYAYDELIDKIESSIEGVGGEEAVFAALDKLDNSRFWTEVIYRDPSIFKLLIAMLSHLSVEHQKRLLLKKFSQESLLTSLAKRESHYPSTKENSRLALYLDYLKNLYERGVFTKEEVWALLEDGAVRKNSFVINQPVVLQFASLCEALLVDADSASIDRCLALWTSAVSRADSGYMGTAVEQYYQFFKKCLGRGGSVGAVVALLKQSNLNSAALPLFLKVIDSDSITPAEKNTLVEITGKLFERCYGLASSEDELKAFIKFYAELKTRGLATHKNLLQLFASNSGILLDILSKYRNDTTPALLNLTNFILKSIVALIEDDGDKTIIKPLFTATKLIKVANYNDDFSDYRVFSFLSYLRYLLEGGDIRIGGSIWLEFIEKDTFDDETLRQLDFCKGQIVAAALRRLRPDSSAPAPVSMNAGFELALAAQDPTRGIGRYLLLMSGHEEATASKTALSELGAPLAREPHLSQVLAAICVGRFNENQLRGLAFLKDDLREYIIAISDVKQRVKLCIDALNVETPLGELFHLRRGMTDTRVGHGNLSKLQAQLQADMAEVLVELKACSFGAIGLKFLGQFRSQLIEQIVNTTTGFWQDYLAAINPGSYLGMYLMANNDFDPVTPNSPLMQELNAALCARPALLLEKIRSGEFCEAWYPALTAAPAALIKYLRSIDVKVLNNSTQLIEWLEETSTDGTALYKFFACHLQTQGYAAELRVAQTEIRAKLSRVADAQAVLNSMSSLNGGGSSLGTSAADRVLAAGMFFAAREASAANHSTPRASNVLWQGIASRFGRRTG